MAIQTQTPKTLRNYYLGTLGKWEKVSQEIHARKLNLDAYSDAALAAALTDAEMTVSETQANQVKSAYAAIVSALDDDSVNTTAALNAALGLRTE